MSVKIFAVDKNSRIARKGIRPGDELLSINGNQIDDVLDYRFYGSDEKLTLDFLMHGSDKHKAVRIRHSDGCDSLGMSFETYLMDKHRHCRNSCIFCFIDQLPKGMRKSLYFKDDDSRLSFLFGNYITLTNLSEHDVERIIKMHISPINASVHTMNPELRNKMMRNPHAGESLSLLKRFSEAGIKINAQLVMCPGINDGDELRFSLEKLSELKSVSSIAAVPVGLTKFREGLYPLKSYNAETAGEVIDIIDSFNKSLIDSGRDKIAYPSDEFFQIANRSLPDMEYYRDFPQLENGVGLITSLTRDFMDALNNAEPDDKERNFAVATGEAAYDVIKQLADAFMLKYNKSHIEVFCIKNKFFGGKVTVAGLIVGRDLIESLKSQDFKSQQLLIPSVMLKSDKERIFLDDTDVCEVEKELNTKIVITACDDGYAMFDLYASL